MKGIVTRTSEVKPQVTIATYTCDECGCENYQEVKAAQFMPLQRCSSATCMKNNSAGKLFLQTRGSKFIKFQELRVQELVRWRARNLAHVGTEPNCMAHG